MIQLITSESEYKAGLFPVIPSRVQGQDTLLIGMDDIPHLVDDYMTTRDIRKGNYNKIARVSTSLFSLDIILKATSKNVPYQFDVTVSVDCRVSNSIAYYMTKSTYSIEGSLNTALARVVNQEAKNFELTDSGINDAIYNKLQAKNHILETLGITYIVVFVEAKPDSDAENNFIKKMTDQRLNVMVEQNRITETEKLTLRNMETAIIGQVADGKIDMKMALEQLNSANRTEGYSKMEDIERLIAFIRKLQIDNVIADDEAEQHINKYLQALPVNLTNNDEIIGIKGPQLETEVSATDETLNELLPDEGDIDE